MAIEPVKMLNTVAPLKDKIINNKVVNKVVEKFEPTGANNSFFGLVSLMLACVIIPRVATAAKRNPDDKEATKDEIKEILFRDIQTVTIILLGLKALDALIGRGYSKLSGLPLTNKKFRNVFRPDANLKPLDRVKNAFKNVVDVINPVGGMVKYSNAEILQKYSGYESMDEVGKMFAQIPAQGGDSQKVYNKVIDNIIENQEKLISQKEVEKTAGFNVVTDKAKEILDKLVSAKTRGVEVIDDKNIDSDVAGKIVEFFQNPNNVLVSSGKKVSALLKTAALAIEVAYLGFGLPALNQKRLEKKYLSGKDEIIKNQFHNAAKDINSSVLVEKTIKPQEVALYSQFFK